MRVALVLVLVIGCGRSADRDREARELARIDLADASVRIRALVTDCSGFARALDRLSRSTISGRSLAGLIDDACEAARGSCAHPLGSATGTGTAQQLARARLLDERPTDALAALAIGASEPAIRFRRAELLDRLGRFDEAIRELDAGLARAPDEAGHHARRLLEVTVAARAARAAEVAAAIAAAPLTDHPALAYRAASVAPAAALDALAAAATEPELATATGDRIELEGGPAAALAAREHAVTRAPDRAELHDAHARALLGARRLADAVAAWDRAASFAPAQPSYRLSPIRALAGLGDAARARERAHALADAARAGDDIDVLVTASTAAAAAADYPLAVGLAREARRRRPGDGRLAFLLADQLAASGERAAAADAYVELLACGAHGRPWHRHEVAAKLVALATDPAGKAIVRAAVAAQRACTAVDREDLARYVEALFAKL